MAVEELRKNDMMAHLLDALMQAMTSVITGVCDGGASL